MAASKLNISRIRDKVSDIKEALTLLRQYAEYDDQKFLENKEAIGAARYYLIVLVEAAMNIANHLCARLLNEAPATYADIFSKLGEKQVISADLASRLASMARFRNLLVHGYGEVDNQRMLTIIRKDLGDVEEFLRAVAGIVNKEEEQNHA